jgi:large subunit ribosomal protein L13
MIEKRSKKIHILDATGKAQGRLATEIVRIISGRHKPEFDPRLMEGEIVRVININKLKFSGKKLDQKKYFRYSGYPGGLKTVTLKNRLAKDPKSLIADTVRKMLPKNKLSRKVLNNLQIAD